jgi:hypothetical protein
MSISTTAYVDLLVKKLYGVDKTDLPTNKSPSNEATASPALNRGDKIWNQAGSIPTTAANVAGVVQGYVGSGAIQCTPDTTTQAVSSVYPSWKTGLTNWISPEFDTVNSTNTYRVSVYYGASGLANVVASGGTQIYADGIGGTQTGAWYFDYIAGTLFFIGDTNTIPSGMSSSSVIYITGYRYIGTTGISTLPSLTVSGTLTANVVSANTYIGNIGGNLTGNVSGNITGTVATFNSIYGNILTAYQPSITGVGTLSNLMVSGNATVGNIVTTGSSYGNVVTDTITPYQTSVVAFTNSTAVGIPTGSSTQYPSANVAGYTRFNTTIGTLEYYNGSNWIPVTNTITDQQITPDGIHNSFTLNQAATTSGVIVSINGTLQTPSVAYTVSGTTITFAEIPQVTDIIDVRFIAAAAMSNSYDYVTIDTGNITVGTSNVTIDSFSATQYRSAKYVISSINGTDGTYAEVGLIQTNGAVLITPYAIMNTGSNSLTFYANISGSTVNFIVNGTTSSNQLRIQRTYFIV